MHAFYSELKSHAEMSDDFVWRDIQLSKGKVNGPRPVTIQIGEKQEILNYRMVPCGGVKVCSVDGCMYTMAIKEHHKCPEHNTLLMKQTSCPVYFVFLEPVDVSDKRRWIAGLVIHQKEQTKHLHTHRIPSASLLESTKHAIHDAKSKCASATAADMACGIGTGYALGVADMAANNTDRVCYEIQKARGPKVDPQTVIYDFKQIADSIDNHDERESDQSGASVVETTCEKYRKIGRPYLRSAGMDEQVNYIVVMSPLMAKILTDAPFLEADVTFDETREYPYMFNVTAFDTVTMKWVVVCRIRITKQTQDAYAMCFRLLFQTCQKD